MAGEEAPCLAAPALSLPLRPCSARGDDHSREGEPGDTSRSERLGTVASDVGTGCWSWPGTTPTFDPPIRGTAVGGVRDRPPIVDQRHIVRRRLLDYDRVYGTNHLSGVELTEVDVDAGNLERFITRQGLPATGTRQILDWCRKRASSTEHGPGTVRPYPGALEVIRWFQLQESTFLGLNTSRPERLRADTLHSLNALGDT